MDPSRRWCGEWLVVAAVALAACADATRSERDARTAATSPPSSSLAVYSPSNPQFLDPNGVAADASGNVYVADTLNCTIRKITPAGAVSTLAGSAGSCGRVDATGTAARFDSPMAVAVDTLGNLYVADYGSDSIRKITPAGTVTTLAGGTWGSADGPGSAAQFYSPMGVAVDASGNVYVADTNNYTIRKITSDGVVSTLAGTAGVTGSADGVGAAAQFRWPAGVAVDGSGDVYVADRVNTNIRKITPDGIVTTFAGTAGMYGSLDGTGAAAQFNWPSGVAADALGNLYVADAGNGTIRQITPEGVVSTLAGTAGLYGSLDGPGAAARFFTPWGVAADVAGNVYVADTCSYTIRKIAPGAVVSTLAGTPGVYGSADGEMSASHLARPYGVASDASGNVYVAEYTNHTIRKITPAGAVSTLAGTPGVYGSADGPGASAQFYGPSAVAVDDLGNVYVADTFNMTVRKITPDGVVSTLAGTPGWAGNADGPGTSAQFASPSALAVDGSGTVYVADQWNFSVRKIAPDGVVTTLAQITACFPYGIAVGHSAGGAVYVGDVCHSSIVKVTPGGVVSTLAGGTWGSTDGAGAAAQFAYPFPSAVDHNGNVYVADQPNGSAGSTIRKVTPAGVVSTVAGVPGQTANVPGPLPASIGPPYGIAVAPTNDRLFFSNTNGVMEVVF